jgi:hypothetical protein
MAERSTTAPAHRFLLECSGACGDLGTFIPHVIGAMTVAGERVLMPLSGN